MGTNLYLLLHIKLKKNVPAFLLLLHSIIKIYLLAIIYKKKIHFFLIFTLLAVGYAPHSVTFAQNAVQCKLIWRNKEKILGQQKKKKKNPGKQKKKKKKKKKKS